MKILIVNPIIYTSETSNIRKVNTIKDTMIYDLCLAFFEEGHDVELIACNEFKPENNEKYPFKVTWLNAKIKKICKPNVLPYCPDIKNVIKNNKYDLIITSEVFSLNSLILAVKSKKNLIVWHELAKHNNIMKKIPSKFWYGVVARIFFRNVLVVPRSTEAKKFISKYCNKVSDKVIDHGVNLKKFTFCEEKDNYFVVSSQLIERKRINIIIDKFWEYTKNYDKNSKLIIIGDGKEKENLVKQVENYNIKNNVIFTGQLNHDKLISYLMKAKAMLVYTRKDNNMISIVESIAVATPVVTTSIPYNSSYIKKYSLGIVNDNWDAQDLSKIANDSSYIKNCLKYRSKLSTVNKVREFLSIEL